MKSLRNLKCQKDIQSFDKYGCADVKPHLIATYIVTGHVSVLMKAHINTVLTTMEHIVQ